MVLDGRDWETNVPCFSRVGLWNDAEAFRSTDCSSRCPYLCSEKASQYIQTQRTWGEWHFLKLFLSVSDPNGAHVKKAIAYLLF